MAVAREEEIKKNFDFFNKNVATLMADHGGEVALIHECKIVAYYTSPAQAIRAGTERFGELPFSVQRVIDRPIDIGFLSHAAGHGIAV